MYAHNFVDVVDLATLLTTARFQNETRCLLYSARVYGRTRDTLLVASGTVFQEVLLWHPKGMDSVCDAWAEKFLCA